MTRRLLLFLLAATALACPDIRLAEAEAEGDDPGECSDGADNDRDGDFDCADADCDGSPDCAESDDDDATDDDDVVDLPPEGLAVDLTPDDAGTASDLQAVLTPATDPEGGTVTHRFEWSVDGALRPDLLTASVPASETARDQTWTVLAVAEDPAANAVSASDTVIIANTAPTSCGVSISPASPEDDDALTCSLDLPATDADAADAVSHAWSWMVDGVVDLAWTTAAIPGDVVEAPEVWTCIATPSDGDLQGPPCQDAVTVTPAPSGCPDGNCALHFDGVDDYVEVPHSAALHPGTTGWTVEAWVRFDQFTGDCMTVVRKGTTGSATNAYWLHKSYAPSNYLHWGAWSAWTVSEPAPLQAQVWHHYAGVYDPVGSQSRSYLDGVLVGTDVPSGAPVPNSDPVRMGIDWDFGCELDGVIDEVRISSTVRYSAAGFLAPSVFTVDADTVALWHFDEYSGSVASDASGGGHHGTIYGAVWTTDNP